MPGSHVTDNPGGRQLVRSIEGETQVPVSLETRMIEGVTSMVLLETSDLNITRYDAKGKIASTNRRVEGNITGYDESSRADQGQTAFS